MTWFQHSFPSTRSWQQNSWWQSKNLSLSYTIKAYTSGQECVLATHHPRSDGCIKTLISLQLHEKESPKRGRPPRVNIRNTSVLDIVSTCMDSPPASLRDMSPCQGWSCEWTQRGITPTEVYVNERDTNHPSDMDSYPYVSSGRVFRTKLWTMCSCLLLEVVSLGMDTY